MVYHDPRHFDPLQVKADVERRRELAGRAAGSGPAGAVISLAWVLLVVAFKLLRLLLLYLLVRPLGRVRSRWLRRKSAPTGEDTAAQIRSQQAKR